MARRPMKAMKTKRKTSVRRKRKSSAGSKPPTRRLRARRGPRRDLRLQDIKNHHDAFGKVKPLYVPNQTNHFVTINGIIRMELKLPQNTTNGNNTVPTIVLASWSPHQKLRLVAFNSFAEFLATDTTAFGQSNSENPISVRPLRASVRVRCTTKATDVSGTIRIIPGEDIPLLSLGSGTQLNAAADWTRWNNFIQSDRKAHAMSASELRTTHRWVMKPGQTIPYQSYHPFYGADANVTDWNFMLEQVRKTEPMTSLVFYLPPTASPQAWEFTMHFQDAAQFSPGTIVQQQAVPPPGGSPDYHQRAQAMLQLTYHQGEMDMN